MKRRSFLHLPLAAPTLLPALPALADQLLTDAATAPPSKSILVRAGEDRSGQRFKWQGGEFDVKVSGKDTDGHYVMFDTFRPEKTGPPLHLHVDCDDRTADAVVFCHGRSV